MPRAAFRTPTDTAWARHRLNFSMKVDAVVEAARSALTLQAARQANSLLDSLPPDLWARLQERLRTSVASAEKVCR